MAKSKFGFFTAPIMAEPSQEFEGDYMEQQGEYVKIMNQPTIESDSWTPEQVVAIRLDKGQFVKKL